MTVFNNAQNLYIHFMDQANGTSGPDDLRLDSNGTSDNPTGTTAFDGKGGDDLIEIGQVGSGWVPVLVEGGSGIDDVTIDASALGGGGFTFHLTSSFSIGSVSVSGVERISLTTGGGDDILTGGNYNDSFSSGAGFDTLRGNDGNDTLAGGDDHDELFGGDGNDNIFGGDGNDDLFGGRGVNTINGGLGSDTVDYSALGIVLGLAVGVNLATQQAFFNNANRDTLTSVENIIGTGFNDRISGTAGVNTFHGLAGDDTLYGGGGDPADVGDFLYGEAGDDTIFGGNGSDTIYGGDDDDTISGGTGYDTMDGGDGRDTLDYTANATFPLKIDLGSGKVFLKDNHGHYQLTSETVDNFETIMGGAADEEFIGNQNNRLYGGAGSDTLRAASGGVALYGGDDDDTLYGGPGDSFIEGGGGVDTVHGGDGNEQIFGGGFGGLGGDGADGDDTIDGGGGDDDIAGMAGNDKIDGGDGSDVVLGGNIMDSTTIAALREAGQLTLAQRDEYDSANRDKGPNTLDGGAGNDYILGAKGKDTIEGGDGNDILYGGAGDDTLYGGKDDEFIFAGDGNDTIESGLGKDKSEGEGGDDTIVVAPLTDGEAFYGGKGFDILDLTAIGQNIILNMATGKVQIAGAHGNIDTLEKIKSGSGDDQLTGDNENNVLLGNGGDDTLNGGDGNDTLDGGAGNNTASYEGGAGVTVNLATGGAQNTGGAGHDTISNIENLIGSAHNDTLTGDGDGNAIDGGNGNDALDGGGGADKITGGAGADTIDGGASADRFIYTAASDSTSTGHDIVMHADFASDKWDVPGNVGGIDAAISHGALSANTFDHDLAAAADATHLKAHHAVLFTPNSGSLSGKVFLIVDLNGTPGYQAHGDLVMQLGNPSNLGSLDANDFI